MRTTKIFKNVTPFNLNSTTYRYTAKFGFTEINLKCVCIKIMNTKNAPIKYCSSTPFLLEPIKKKRMDMKEKKKPNCE